ncbi:MAG TPA: MtrAB system histidine kinase MtrB [Actinomycetaceae bacterium]|nr:MtrAB system histidine kinase MtrB [Actinomycetaceae bacterium]
MSATEHQGQNERSGRTRTQPFSRLRRFGQRMRKSLVIRVTFITATALTLALALVAIYVSTTVRTGLFTARVDQALGDASWRVSQAQTRLDQASAATVEQVQGTAQDLVISLQEPGSGVVGAMLLRADREDSEAVILEPITNAALRNLPTDELREAVNGSSTLHWQSVEIPTGEGAQPGIVVGSEVSVPLAGYHELYLVYTLEPEQRTINLTMRALLGASIFLILMVAAIVWMMMWRVLRPVRQAALSAERLAAGVLDARVPVRGEDELATLARSFNEMADSMKSQITQLEDLSRLQQRFVSDVSHELRTPLTTIRMAADLLHRSRESFDPVTRRSAELLVAQLDRFESMLADLLEISRMDAGAELVGIEEQDLRPLIRRVRDLAAPLAERAGSRIRLQGMDKAATAAIDEVRVERIVRNLVLNAVEHCEGTPIDVCLASNDTAVAVRVTDAGVGLDPEALARVFDRFWRADPARARATGGTGLGLAISQEDARLHGGTLEAWGEEGIAASFLLTLPKFPGEDFEPPLDVIPPALANLISAEQEEEQQPGTAFVPVGSPDDSTASQPSSGKTSPAKTSPAKASPSTRKKPQPPAKAVTP